MQTSLQNSNLFNYQISSLALDFLIYVHSCLFISLIQSNCSLSLVFFFKKTFECKIFLGDENVSARLISVNPTVQVMFSSVLVLLFTFFFLCSLFLFPSCFSF
jgi:hypothetical protein